MIPPYNLNKINCRIYHLCSTAATDILQQFLSDANMFEGMKTKRTLPTFNIISSAPELSVCYNGLK